MKLVRYPVVAVVAALAGMLGAIPVASIGLVVPMYVVWPLTLGVAALMAAIVADWTSNLLMVGRSRLLAVVGATEIAALVLLVLTAVPFFVPALRTVVPGGPLIYMIGACGAVIGMVAAVASLRLRGTRERLGRDAALTLALVVVAVLVVAATLALSCSTLVTCMP